MLVEDWDTLSYREAFVRQEAAHADVLAGGAERVILVEHPPTITLGRRAADAMGHLKVCAAELKRRQIDLVESDRGGDITYHGPGQIVCYPILRLSDHGLSVGGYVRLLQETVVCVLDKLHVSAELDPSAVGVWVRRRRDGALAKLCAIGVRVRRGVTTHGLALNVETDLRQFSLIDPCGLGNRPVTSLRDLLGARAPSMLAVKTVLTGCLREAIVKRTPFKAADSETGSNP